MKLKIRIYFTTYSIGVEKITTILDFNFSKIEFFVNITKQGYFGKRLMRKIYVSCQNDFL